MQTPNTSIVDETNCPDKLRDSGLGSDSFSGTPSTAFNTPGSDCANLLIFEFNDLTENDNNEIDKMAAKHSPNVSSTPLKPYISQISGEVFQKESFRSPSKEDLTITRNSRRNSSFKTHLQTIDTILPVGRQRHTNFTPPRQSPVPQNLDLEQEDPLTSYECIVHQRRSSACLILCKCDLEKEIGEDLRSVSDSFNVRCVGLGDGYHLMSHPHSTYHKTYSSSYPGSPSILRQDSIGGLKVGMTKLDFHVND